MDSERLIAMANQIGRFFQAQGEAAVIDGVEDHLRKYWDPRMRGQILEILREGGTGLTPGVRQALGRLTNSPNGG